jgi:hypothetical protein
MFRFMCAICGENKMPVLKKLHATAELLYIDSLNSSIFFGIDVDPRTDN